MKGVKLIKPKRLLTLKDKALLVIEAITSDDTIEELCLREPKDATAQLLLRKLLDIYQYAHIARNPSCIKSHDDWVKELEDTYKEFNEHGIC